MKHRLRWLILILIVAVGLAACSSGEQEANATSPAEQTSDLDGGISSLLSSYTVRPVDDIIDAPLEVTNFAAGSASLPIQTSVPVACTVVYGETPAFGSLTLDQDMAGGTHSDHNPLLSDLKPETEYYFRVQGLDDDGVLYVSEVMTFTTPPEPEDDQVSENLASPARGAEIAGFSSAFGGAAAGDRWGALSAFDDNPNTEWSSGGDGDAAWVEVRLAGPAQIEAIEFHSRAMSDGSAITRAFVITAGDGQEYGPFELPDTSGPHRYEVDFQAQTLRFNLVETTGGNTGAVDIAVYGQMGEGN